MINLNNYFSMNHNIYIYYKLDTNLKRKWMLLL
jgi:hypothetical protein